jgi:hypothetical protein
MRLSVNACLPALNRVEPVDRFSAKIHQIAAHCLKRLQEVRAGQDRKRGDEGFAHGAIKPRIRAVEKTPRSRRRFADKKYFDLLGPEASPQSFA